MYFLSRNTFKYRSFVSFSPWVLYGGSFLLLVLISFLWWLLLYRPLQGLHTQYMNHVIQLQAAVDQIQTKEREKHHIDESYEYCKGQLRNEQQSMMSYDQYMLNIFNMLSSCHMLLLGYTPSKELDKQWYSKKVVHYSLQGTFDQCMNFFQRLAQSTMCVQCTHFSIDAMDDGILHISAMFDFIQTKSEWCV